MTLTDARTYLELLYFCSGVVVAILAVLGLRQLSLLKYDIRTKNQRAAKESAVEYVNRYMKSCVPICNSVDQYFREHGIPAYPGRIGHLPVPVKDDLQKRFAVERWVELLNEIEVITSAINSGICDEEDVFNAVGTSLCDTISRYYDILWACRLPTDEYPRHFNNTASLYKRWSERIREVGLRSHHEEIEKELSALGVKKIKSIGTQL